MTADSLIRRAAKQARHPADYARRLEAVIRAQQMDAESLKAEIALLRADVAYLTGQRAARGVQQSETR